MNNAIIWAPAFGWEDQYEISTDGRLRAIHREVRCVGRKYRPYVRLKRRCVLRPSDNGTGYLSVSLTPIGGRTKCRSEYIHRLVALTFIPVIQGSPHVNHKNLDKRDNRVDNLEWVTRSQNQLHWMLARNHRGENKPNSKLTVATLAKARVWRTGGMGYRQIAAKCGVSLKCIWNALKGLTWKTPG